MKKITTIIFLLVFAVQSIVAAQSRSAAEQARMAYICALADMAVYDTTMNQAVREVMDKLGWEFTDYKNADSRANTTFYTVAYDGGKSNERKTLVVIPGTEKMKDIEVDLRFGKVLFGGVNPAEFRQYAEVAEVASTQPMVHRGFNDYTMTAFFTPNEQQKMGADYLREMVENTGDHLYLTGHSLGGAVATLLAARLISAGADPDKISVFTFGAPSVGNIAFAEEYGYRIDLSRYTMSGDLVKNALQMLKADYTHFGTEYKWQKNENSHKHNHAMAGYLDAAIRSYYDEVLSGDLSLQRLATLGPQDFPENESQYVTPWFKATNDSKVYLAPVYTELHDLISNDANYMQLVAGNILMDQFQNVVVGNALTADSLNSSVDTLFAACQAAEEAECGTVAMINITAEADKATWDLYRMAVDVSFYNVAGVPLTTSMTSTTTKDITPIEAVMYDMARISGDIRQAQEEGALPK